MDRVKKWLLGKKMGSTDAIFMKPGQDSGTMDFQEPIQSNYELTSIKIKHLLEKKEFQKVVNLLRECPRDYVLSCLESFPFITLNKAVPASFLIWETILTKLKNSEEDYIPQFPYKSCDDLVMRVAWLLETSKPGTTEEVSHSCRRVLKCVFMQYNEVLEQLYKEHERVDYALHTLSLHSPLGPGGICSGLSIEQTIKEEVQASLEDYATALECLNDRRHDDHKNHTESDEGIDGHKLSPGSGGVDGDEGDEFASRQMDAVLAPNPTQVQLHVRLYENQRVFTALQPSRRSDTLPQLINFLKERIHGDKEVLYLFGKIRDRNPTVDKYVPVQPWLCKYQHALDLAIGVLKDIEKDLEITVGVPRVESPVPFCTIGAMTPADDGGLQMVPISSGKLRSRSHENERSYHHRHSAAPVMDYFVTMGEGKVRIAKPGPIPRRNLSVPHTHRPRSTSPHKLLHVNGSSSMKSINSKSNTSSSTNLATGSTSSSVHDLYSAQDYPPSLAFTRVQSLKTHNSVQVVAGKRKKGLAVFPNSLINLTSISTGSVNGHSNGGKKAKKNLYGSSSGELEQAWDRHVQVT